MLLEEKKLLNEKFEEFLKSVNDEDFIAKLDWFYEPTDFFDIECLESLKKLNSYQDPRNYENKKSDLKPSDKSEILSDLSNELRDGFDISYITTSQMIYLIEEFLEKYDEVSKMYYDEQDDQDSIFSSPAYSSFGSSSVEWVLDNLDEEVKDNFIYSISFDLNIEDLLENTKIQVQLEMDYDNLSVEGYKMIDDKEALYAYINENGSATDISEFMKNFIASQGYELDDFKDEEKVEKSPFLSSLSDEFLNLFDSQGGALSSLFTMPVSDFIDILCNEYEKMVIPTGTLLGFFEAGVGGGSLMGVKLEKDFVFPVEYCYFTPISRRTYPYTICDVYGITADKEIAYGDLKKYN